MRPLLLAALVGSLALAPQLVSAADEKMSTAPAGNMMVMCHAPKTGEKANTQMMTDKSMWVCTPADMKKMMAGPDMTNVKTAEEANKAWKAFLESQTNPR